MYPLRLIQPTSPEGFGISDGEGAVGVSGNGGRDADDVSVESPSAFGNTHFMA